jgi:hypothetical protein
MAETTADNAVLVDETTENDLATEEQNTLSTYMTIGERFEMYNVALTNTLNDAAILAAMSRFNYKEEKVRYGMELLESTRAADAQNKKEYGEQYAAAEKVEKEFKEASGPYIESLEVGRIAMKNNAEAIKALVLKGKRSQSLPKWIHDADVFYRNILSTERFLTRMNEFGRTREILEAEYKEVKDVQDAHAAHQKEMGEAKESTAVRDAKMVVLDDWMSDFIAIARVAFKGNPEALKKLGL